ncbi:MAG: preprotein translocase subunit SecE [Thermoleophilaceae bacterium]
MARNRQRAKERQAARRASRAASGEGARPDERLTPESAAPGVLGQGGQVFEPEPEVEEADAIDEAADRELELEAEEAGAFTDEPVEEIAPETATGPRGVRGGDAVAVGAQKRGLARVWEFLQNVWAELQRVQWPDRKQVTTLTGVVLGFVLIAGGYLGLLDAIFSRVIDQII